MVIPKKATKNIDYYLNLPWTYTIETGKENGKIIYIVHVNELPGLGTDAPSLDEAMNLIKDAMKAAFELYMEDGEEIPEPIHEDQYKGNIAYRTSSTRHYKLVREAKKRNVSISQVLDLLVDGVLTPKNRN